jgi:phosphoglycerate kinase
LKATKSETFRFDECPKAKMILDAGPNTVKNIESIVNSTETLIWNGPLGAFETKPYDNATNSAALIVAERTNSGKLISVAGGGDTVSALRSAGCAENFSYLSTAGGAFLAWLEGRSLPGISALEEK